MKQKLSITVLAVQATTIFHERHGSEVPAVTVKLEVATSWLFGIVRDVEIVQLKARVAPLIGSSTFMSYNVAPSVNWRDDVSMEYNGKPADFKVAVLHALVTSIKKHLENSFGKDLAIYDFVLPPEHARFVLELDLLPKPN